MTFGRQLLTPQVNNPISVLANYDKALWHPVGITLDWTLFTAVSGTAVTLPDGIVVPIGYKGARYGAIFCQATSGGSSGLWGPYDSTASDGRQTLARGLCVVLESTILQSGVIPGLLTGPSSHPPVLDGGLFWQARLLDSTQTNPLGPNGPTFAALEAVLTSVEYVLG